MNINVSKVVRFYYVTPFAFHESKVKRFNSDYDHVLPFCQQTASFSLLLELMNNVYVNCSFLLGDMQYGCDEGWGVGREKYLNFVSCVDLGTCALRKVVNARARALGSARVIDNKKLLQSHAFLHLHQSERAWAMANCSATINLSI